MVLKVFLYHGMIVPVPMRMKLNHSRHYMKRKSKVPTYHRDRTFKEQSGCHRLIETKRSEEIPPCS